MITLTELILLEQAYKGNIGMMEIMEFFNKASPSQKRELEALIKAKKNDDAWNLIELVTGVKLDRGNI